MTDRAIAVIFARGTGDAIPLISARLVAGKPMLHYTIRAAQESKYIDRVYVSTEDERIAAVAKAASAEVIMRPEEFSGGQTPMSAAAEHAARCQRSRAAEHAARRTFRRRHEHVRSVPVHSPTRRE